jgi:hypothetical protein
MEIPVISMRRAMAFFLIFCSWKMNVPNVKETTMFARLSMETMEMGMAGSLTAAK